MREGDLDAVVRIEHAAFGEKNRDAQHFTDEIARGWSRPWVLRDRTSGDIYGFLLAWHVADELDILDVAVHPDARRQGHGLRLMRYALTYARENQVRLVILEVRMSNVPAIALYDSLGFARVNVRKKYYPDGEDAVEMHLTV